MTFVACSDEDNKVTRPTYTGCQTCEILAINGESREDYEVCVDADGVAYVADANTGIAAADYFTMYCDNAYGGTTTPGDGGTPDVNCVTCAAFTEGTTKVPESERLLSNGRQSGECKKKRRDKAFYEKNFDHPGAKKAVRTQRLA